MIPHLHNPRASGHASGRCSLLAGYSEPLQALIPAQSAIHAGGSDIVLRVAARLTGLHLLDNEKNIHVLDPDPPAKFSGVVISMAYSDNHLAACVLIY